MEINGEYWEILLVSPFDPLLYMRDGHFAIGVCDNDLKVIAINENLDDFYLKKVLCHELTHAAMYSYNIELTYT
jgi:Zn-dependent peptidase ImmA (M78 family)